MNRFALYTASLLFLGLAACGSGDDHGHDHGPDSHDHGGHDHGADEHAHGDDDHGHGHGGGIVVTDFTDATELFVEFPPFAVGRESPFAAHFTRLDTFAPVGDGEVIIRLSGGGVGEEVFRAGPSPTAGIFRPVAVPRNSARRKVTVELISGDLRTVHDLGEYQVYRTADEADASLPEEAEDETLIPFLKEQQWKVDFATAPVEQRALSHSISAPGRLEPAPGGDGHIAAAADGIVLAPVNRDLPNIGDSVAAGDVIARLLPQLSGDAASAEALYRAARADLVRVEALFEDGAVSQRRVDEARAAAAEANARRIAADQTLNNQNAGITLRAPVSGRIAARNVVESDFVSAGDPLFRIVNTSRLQLTAKVAEVDAVALGEPSSAWFTTAGNTAVIDISQHDGRLVGASGAIDPVSRTVPVVFEFNNHNGVLRAGMSVSARVRTGQTFDGPSVPVTALIDDAGQDVVFVMVDGENWERRVVRVAVRDGDRVGVASGLTPGERVVSRGAYLVHLAASGPAEAGHGHAH